jgi:hypothetical protein
MKSSEYIKKAITELLIMFPSAKCRYEHKNYSEMHLLEITPISFLENEAFIEASERLVDDFIDNYPLESMSFLPKNSMVKISQNFAAFFGKNYIEFELASVNQIKEAKKIYVVDKLLKRTYTEVPIKINEGQTHVRSNQAGENRFAMAA